MCASEGKNLRDRTPEAGEWGVLRFANIQGPAGRGHEAPATTGEPPQALHLPDSPSLPHAAISPTSFALVGVS